MISTSADYYMHKTSHIPTCIEVLEHIHTILSVQCLRQQFILNLVRFCQIYLRNLVWSGLVANAHLKSW